MFHRYSVLFLTICVLCLVIFITNSNSSELPTEISTTLYCDTYKTIISDLMIDYEEKLVWEGQREEDVYAALFLNETTGSWTLLFYDNNKAIACVSLSGIGFNIP